MGRHHMIHIVIIMLLLMISSSMMVQAAPRSRYEYSTDEYLAQFDTEEYKKYLGAQKTDALTPEQIEEGWVLFDGYAYPPNETADGIGEYVRGENMIQTEDTGEVTFIAHPDDTVSHNCYVAIKNLDDHEEYEFFCDAVDGWVHTADVPVGVYVIIDGGVVDSEIPYMVSESNFEVSKDEHIDIAFAVTSSKKHLHDFQADASGNTIQNGDNPEPIDIETAPEHHALDFLRPFQANEEPTNGQKVRNAVGSIVAAIVILGGVAIAIYIYWREKNMAPPED